MSSSSHRGTAIKRMIRYIVDGRISEKKRYVQFSEAARDSQGRGAH
jgi:hypothetical protein